MLLVHGFTSSAQIDWIEPGWPQALAAQGRGTVAVDLPGHGLCPAADRDAISVSAIIAGLVAFAWNTPFRDWSSWAYRNITNGFDSLVK